MEHHVRRLAIPLLKRAGERARLHKEAPETLRFGFRRASKGYGVRVSRQCPVSSGVAAAFAVLPPPAAGGAGVTGASAAGTRVEEGGPVESPVMMMTGGAVAAGAAAAGTAAAEARSPMVMTGAAEGTATAAAVVAVPTESPTTTGTPLLPLQQKQQHETAAAEAALSEAVRLVMALFDKMVHPEEEEKGKLDLTLLSVGLAGFRGLGGGAQSGMARSVAQLCVCVCIPSQRVGAMRCPYASTAHHVGGSHGRLHNTLAHILFFPYLNMRSETDVTDFLAEV